LNHWAIIKHSKWGRRLFYLHLTSNQTIIQNSLSRDLQDWFQSSVRALKLCKICFYIPHEKGKTKYMYSIQEQWNLIWFCEIAKKDTNTRAWAASTQLTLRTFLFPSPKEKSLLAGIRLTGNVASSIYQKICKMQRGRATSSDDMIAFERTLKNYRSFVYLIRNYIFFLCLFFKSCSTSDSSVFM